MVASEPVRGLVEAVVSGVAQVVTLEEARRASPGAPPTAAAVDPPRAQVLVHMNDGPDVDAGAIQDEVRTVITLDGPDDQGAAWLNPDNARRWLNDIAQVLGDIDPVNEIAYASNARGMRARLDALTSEISLILLPVSGQAITVDRADLGPFAERFDVTLEVSEGEGVCHVPLPPPLAEDEEDGGASAAVAVNRYIRLMREIARRLVDCASDAP